MENSKSEAVQAVLAENGITVKDILKGFNAEMAPKKRLMTIPEAAEYLGMSKRTLYDQLAPSARKKFPIKGKRINGCLRLDRYELDAYLDSI